ncbi:unnamed protein product [Sphagnum jensenii]|uniref:Uncharacterized protein n=1 Tax=Sphagnum jensenii TaxID=128206 RepID=A0ABP0WNU9_9BRYO
MRLRYCNICSLYITVNKRMHESHNQPLFMRLGSSRVATLQGMRPIGLLLEAAKHETDRPVAGGSKA